MGLLSGKCFICGQYAPSRLKHGEWICGNCVKDLGGFFKWGKIRNLSKTEIEHLRNKKHNHEYNNKIIVEDSSNGIDKIASHIYADNMDGIEFERFCGERLIKAGAVRVEYTAVSNDFGADIIAYLKDGTKWVVQCKCYSGKVGNSAVQEAVSAIPHYKANGAIIMTNSELTANARELAKDNGVWLFEHVR